MQKLRYKSYDIVIDGNNFDVLQGKHILALGWNDDPEWQAKSLIDGDFVTPLLIELRKIVEPKIKRDLD